MNDLIYGYGQPVYISYTSNPPGILIVIYADGVANEIVEFMKLQDLLDEKEYKYKILDVLKKFDEQNGIQCVP